MLKVVGLRTRVLGAKSRSRFIVNSAIVSCAAIAAMGSVSAHAKDKDTDVISPTSVSIEDLQFRAQVGQLEDQAARAKILNAPPATTTQSSGVQPTAAAAAAALPPGQFRKADGSLTTDLEAAAQTWRDDPEFALNPSYAKIGAEYAYARGITGAGVKIGVMDGGISDLQGEFGDRLHLLNTRPLLNIPADEYPLEYGAFDGRALVGYSGETFHGTHVGGTIGAARNGVGMQGVAYGAELYSATAFFAYDGFVIAREGQLDAQSPGIRALVDQDVRIINNSWGSNFQENEDEIPVTIDPATMTQWLNDYYNVDDTASRDAFRYAADHGTVMIFANGNSSRGVDDNKGEMRAHANVQASAPMALPELENTWLAVASVNNDGVISDFSQECGGARFWCVSAPGEDVASTAAVRAATLQDALAYAATLPFDITDKAAYDAANAADFQLFQDHYDPSGMARSIIRAWALGVITAGGGLDLLIPPGRDGLPNMVSDIDLLDLLITGQTRQYLAFAGGILQLTGETTFEEIMRKFEYAYLDELMKLNPNVRSGNYLASGTSMATPHTSASLGLVMERYKYLNGALARQVLLTTADDLGETGVDTTYGWGLINVKNAMNGPGAFLTDWDVTMAQGVTDTWSNNITNGSIHTGRDQDHGRLILNGNGNLTLAGNNSFDGVTLNGGTLNLTASNVFTTDTLVNGGVFNLSGSLDSSNLRINGGTAVVAPTGKLVNTNLYVGAQGGTGTAYTIFNGLQSGGTTTVAANGFLGGNGTLGSTTVYGTISPGESIGKLTINGDYVQKKGSKIIVEMTPPDKVDQVAVNGKATIEGGTVVANLLPGTFALGQRYKFLTATGGVTGTYDTLTTTQPTPFLKLGLVYEPNLVSLDIKRGATFVSAAGTPNQTAVATAVDGSPDNNLVVQSLVLLPSTAAAQAALDSLSGEIYASAQNGLLNSSRITRDTALSHAATAGAKSADASGTWVWIDGISGSGELEGNGNFATLDTRNSGMFFGVDQQFAGNFLLGGFVGWGKDKYRADERRSSANADVMNFGLYAGKNWGGLGVRVGGTYSTYDFRANRHVVFPGVDQKLESEFDAKSHQVFAEAGYSFGNERFTIEPFVRYAKVWTKSDALDETGGFTALSVAKRKTNTDLGIFGARAEVGLIQPSEGKMDLRLHAGVSRQQVLNGFDGRNSLMTAAWDGGDPFTVQGALYPKSATNVDASLIANINNRARIQAGYVGQFTNRGNDNGINVRFSLKF